MRSLFELGDRTRVVSKIDLASDENDRQPVAKVQDLGDPLREAKNAAKRMRAGQ